MLKAFYLVNELINKRSDQLCSSSTYHNHYATYLCLYLEVPSPDSKDRLSLQLDLDNITILQ